MPRNRVPRPVPVPPLQLARRPGRPALIDLDRIVAAAKDIDVEGLSMSAVAARLGISASGLYHHVKGREALARLAAQSTLADADVPPDDGRPWADWMLAYARFLRTVLRHHGAISHVHPGETGSPTSLDRLEQVLHVLVRAGFSKAEAIGAFMVVTNCISGFVHQDIQIESEARAGRPYLAEFHRALAAKAPDELPILRSLPESGLTDRDTLFDDQIRTVLAGVQARHAQAGAKPGEQQRRRRRVRERRQGDGPSSSAVGPAGANTLKRPVRSHG
jgi:TetR/AcrR family tetracycline transcriptional repressor